MGEFKDLRFTQKFCREIIFETQFEINFWTKQSSSMVKSM
jgi:hypothetical protein